MKDSKSNQGEELLDIDDKGNPIEKKEKKEMKDKSKSSTKYKYVIIPLIFALIIALIYFFYSKNCLKRSIFDKTKLKNLNLKNRILFGAALDNSFQKGKLTQEGVDKFENLAKNDVSLLVTSGSIIGDYTSIPMPGREPFRIDKDEFIEEYKKLTEVVHKHNSYILMQMVHIGLFSPEEVVYSPSINKCFVQDKYSKEMTKNDIERIKNLYAEAAIRAKKAGFDGIEIHACHMSLVSLFLSPVFNRRTDEYGGSDEKRAKFLVEIIQKVRETVGDSMIISVKLDSEGKNQTIVQSGFLTAGKMAAEAGVD